MPACRACVHPDRDRIDLDIINGQPLRAITSWSGLSLGGLSRHREHVKELIRERSATEREEHASSLVQRVTRLVGKAEKFVEVAEAEKNYRGATSALVAACKLLDLLGRLDGQLGSANTPGLHVSFHKTVNVNFDSDDKEFAEMIGEATRGFSIEELMRLKRIAEGQKVLPPCNDLAPPL
jgi:hypothetical protein